MSLCEEQTQFYMRHMVLMSHYTVVALKIECRCKEQQHKDGSKEIQNINTIRKTVQYTVVRFI